MSIAINRAFVSRAFGEIGSVVFTAPEGEYAINGKALPPSSVNHLLTFALQTLQDAYAGAKDAAEAEGAFNGKLDKLLAGTIGTRSSGGGVTAWDKVGRIVVGDWFRNTFAKENPTHEKVVAYKDADTAGRYAILDAILADNEEVFAEAIEEEIAARKAKSAKVAKIKVSI